LELLLASGALQVKVAQLQERSDAIPGERDRARDVDAADRSAAR